MQGCFFWVFVKELAAEMRIFSQLRTRLSSVSANLLLIAGVACATSPTGRSQLNLVPDSQMNALGAQAFQEMKTQIPVEGDPRLNQYVQCVAAPITKISEDRTGVSEWEVVVFRDPSANAFALPGGKIGVHTGLLEVAKNDAQLATVLGHEVGHVIARHGNERVSQGIVAQLGMETLGVLTRQNPNRDRILALVGLGAQVGILLPYSRAQESEADVIGLDLMARAGFDPRQSVDLWRNMMRAGGGGEPPEFLSTHPAGQSRIEVLSSSMPAAMSDYERARQRGKSPRCVR